MKRELFIKEYEKTVLDYNPEWENHLINTSIEANLKDGNPRGHRGLIISMEELAEMQQAISKHLRGKGDIINIIEELADVQIVLQYIMNICNVDSNQVQRAKQVKLIRLQQELEKNGFFK